MDKLVIDENGILASSWIAIHPLYRPTVYYQADGEVLDAQIMPTHPEYVSVQFARYSVCMSADGSWFDFAEDDES